MKKKIIFIISMIMLTSLVAVVFVACTPVGNTESISGTYYSYDKGALNKSDYIIIKDGKWSDSEELSGTYKVTNGTIEFYIEILGKSEMLYDGTIKDGVIKLNIMGIEHYYCKEGKTPSNSNNNNNNNDTPTPINKYTVTYDGNGGTFADGSKIYSQNVNANSLLTAPTSPTRQGYSFSGWANKKSGSDMWQFAEDKVLENITLYAQWTEKTAVVLSVDGASIEDNSIFMVVDHTIDYVSLATKVVCSSDSVWRLYYDKLGLTEIPTKIATQKTGELDNGNNIFYIVVTSQGGTQVNTYELTIHRSYLVNIDYIGVYGNSIDSKTTYSGYNYSVTYTPSIRGYTFNYWKDESGKKTTSFVPYSSTSLYAECTVNTYTATLDVNGGNELMQTSYTMTYDKSFTYPKPSRSGYTFLGWFVGSTQITNATGSSFADWEYANNMTITAKWQANKYEVTLNNNNTQAGTLSGSGEHYYDSNVTITATPMNGYTFLGWYDGNDNQISSMMSYNFKMGGDITFIAKWEYYTLTTLKNNTCAGTVTNYNNSKVTAGEYVTITASSNDGYVFIGWYDGDILLSNELKYKFSMPKENITYTANWSEITLITDNLSAGNISPIGSYKVGDLATITATTYLGYIFDGWYDGEKQLSDKESYTFNVFAENITYTAKWQIKDEMLPFEFASTVATCSIKKVSDNTLKEIIVPDYVTSIKEGAFNGCSNLVSLTLPFIGASPTSSTGANNSSANPGGLFGYIFGGESYSNSLAIVQRWANSRVETYYIPASLKNIVLTEECKYIDGGAFSNCSKLIIYCEVKSKPSGWCHYWNEWWTSWQACPVVWDCKEYGITDDGYEWGLTNKGTISITRYSGVLTDLIMPAKINGYDVTEIANNAFYKCSTLNSIKVSDGIMGIGYNAFYECSGLTSIEIPRSVTSIGEDAFNGCSSLASIEIPICVEIIGIRAFDTCKGLTIYCESDKKPSGWESAWNGDCPVVWNCKNNEIASDGSIYYIDENDIKYALKDDLATVVGQSCFISGAKVIPYSITYKDTLYSVTSIGSSAFAGCRSLTSIVIPISVTSIGSSAFRDCSSLTIYCEASSKPSGWNSGWNIKSYAYGEGYSYHKSIVWNYKQ